MSQTTPTAASTCATSCACAQAGWPQDSTTPPFDAATCLQTCTNDLSKNLQSNVCRQFSYDLMGTVGSNRSPKGKASLNQPAPTPPTCALVCTSQSDLYTNTCTEDVCLTQCANFNACYPVAQNGGDYGNGLDAWPSQ